MARYSIYRPRAGETSGDLRRELDALLGRFGAEAPDVRRGVYPAVNLYETEDTYVLSAELPGVSPDDIEVSVEGATVTLGGERKIEYEGGASAHRRERQSGRFRRSLELPLAVDPGKVEAVHKNGVLMLRLPKAAEHRPRRISVRAG